MRIQNPFLLLSLIAGFGLLLADRVTAQTFTTLHSFTNSDGAKPYAGLILVGNTLYGTTLSGGTNDNGTVFAVNTDGTGFTTLHSFSVLNSNSPSVFINSDGASPRAGLILSGNTLYGTAWQGGTNGYGTVFVVNANGTGFTVLHTFTVNDGANPFAGLILSGNTLYGTAFDGGTDDSGTVFAVNTDGTGFTDLYNFTGDNDGGNPAAGLILSGNTLYGTTWQGGNDYIGTVFAVNTNGTDFTTLHSFTGGNDGDMPVAGLILSGNTLYGTAPYGGNNFKGTVFAVNTNGTGFTILYSFTGGNDGDMPVAGLILSGNTLYGTTSIGGIHGAGTVFSLSFPLPQLTIIRSGTNVSLTWPSSVAGFSYSGFALQSTTNVVSSDWTAVSTASVVVNGQNNVTIPISGTQQFYRLSQ
jgi:uncharacterized repeat protein (TIGR03803 family)